MIAVATVTGSRRTGPYNDHTATITFDPVANSALYAQVRRQPALPLFRSSLPRALRSRRPRRLQRRGVPGALRTSTRRARGTAEGAWPEDGAVRRADGELGCRRPRFGRSAGTGKGIPRQPRARRRVRPRAGLRHRPHHGRGDRAPAWTIRPPNALTWRTCATPPAS